MGRKPIKRRNSEFHRLQKEVYWAYMNNCLRKHLNFPVTMAEFIPFTTQNCYYCGREPSNTMQKLKHSDEILLYQGVDRKSNVRGYVLDNLVPCCHPCNSIKGNHLTYDEMIQLAPLLRKLREDRIRLVQEQQVPLPTTNPSQK